MKNEYQTPDLEVVSFAAMENIAVITDPKASRDGEGIPGGEGSVGSRYDDLS